MANQAILTSSALVANAGSVPSVARAFELLLSDAFTSSAGTIGAISGEETETPACGTGAATVDIVLESSSFSLSEP